MVDESRSQTPIMGKASNTLSVGRDRALTNRAGPFRPGDGAAFPPNIFPHQPVVVAYIVIDFGTPLVGRK